MNRLSIPPVHPREESQNHKACAFECAAGKRIQMATQNALFPGLESKLQRAGPEGFRYEEDIVSEAEEAALVASLAMLELKPFEFHGHLGNRRVASFGYLYDFTRRAVQVSEEFPLF